VARSDSDTAPAARLIDGSKPLASLDVLARLDALGIDHVTVCHPPLHTVEEARRLRGPVQGAHVKNLFLRNKRGTMWLLALLAHRRVDLRSLGDVLGSGRLSFCSERRLMERLGVRPGCVTPLAVVHDTERVVHVLLDRGLLEHAHVNVHPLVNDKTTRLRTEDLLAFLEAEGHPARLVDLPEID
jgi:Ala-tRNA(Pro) deacylase